MRSLNAKRGATMDPEVDVKLTLVEKYLRNLNDGQGLGFVLVGTLVLNNEFLGKVFLELGDADGIGLLVRLASIDVDNDGHISDDEYARFIGQCSEWLAGCQGSVLNVCVISLSVSRLSPVSGAACCSRPLDAHTKPARSPPRACRGC